MSKPNLVESRDLITERKAEWRLSIFDDGQTYLGVHVNGVDVQLHFSADEWAAFQELVRP